MPADAPQDSGRKPIAVPDELHARITRIMHAMTARTGRKSITYAEVIERALDRAAMEEDTS